MHGISLLLGLCAASWLSGGEADRGAGLLALAGSVLAMAGAGRLAAFLSTSAVRPRAAARRRARADQSTDWLALPDVPWEDEQARGAVQGGKGERKPEPTGVPQGAGGRSADDDDADVVVVSRDEVTADVQMTGFGHVEQAEPGVRAGEPATAGRVATGRAGATGQEATDGRPVARPADGLAAAVSARSYGWIAAVSAAAAESAIYGGLAAGGGPARPLGMWPLAVLTIAAVGPADLLGASRAAAVAAARGPVPVETPPDRNWPRRLPGLPRGARLALAGLALLLAGPQAALFAVLGAELIALAWMVAALGRISPPADAASGSGAARARRRGARGTRGGAAAVLGAMSTATGSGAAASEGGTRTRVTALVGVDGPAGTTAVRIITSARATKTSKGQGADADAAGRAVGDVNRDAAGREEATGGEPGEPILAPGPPEPARRADDGPVWVAGSAGERDEPIAVGGVAGPARPAHAERAQAEPATAGPATAGPAWTADQAGVGAAGDSQAGSRDSQYPAAVNPHRIPGGVLALRDDGAAALWAGRLVQGNLIPLPPALAGLVATAMLAALGLRGLHGLVAMTPPIVMMLAAPGSSHPHDGRFDWLVPGLLLLAQYVYLGALGFAVGVPHPIIFAACALTGLWYVSLAARAGDGTNAGGTNAGGINAGGAADIVGLARVRGARAGAGWEVRLFLTGLAVTFGLGTFGYVGLAAYLGVLLVRQAANRHRYLTRVEDDRQ